MPAAPLCCPSHRESLIVRGTELHGEHHGEIYPVVDGIPILIANHDERRRLAGQTLDGEPEPEPAGESALDFYNNATLQENYGRVEADLPTLRLELEGYLKQVNVEGPVLEIGSGRGVAQGVGGTDYVALDYSLNALRRYVRPEYQRVCASAEQLPFFDQTFRCVYSIAALEHVTQADRAFDEIDRVLRPGGLAYLSPAWHCVQYNCEGIPVRPYRDLTLRQKLVKATLPIRKHSIFKGLAALPSRMARRAIWAIRKNPTHLRFHRLTPEYKRYWTADSDACSRLDSHEGCLYFHSRNYELISPGGSAREQLLARHGPVIVRKRP